MYPSLNNIKQLAHDVSHGERNPPLRTRYKAPDHQCLPGIRQHPATRPDATNTAVHQQAKDLTSSLDTATRPLARAAAHK